MPRLVRAKTANRKIDIDPDAIYAKAVRMIKGCKTKEQLHTTFNFIDLLSVCVPDSLSQEKLEKIREEYNLKEASLFGSSIRKKPDKKYLKSLTQKGILGMNPFRRNKK